jgi:hypothetical protein
MSAEKAERCFADADESEGDVSQEVVRERWAAVTPGRVTAAASIAAITIRAGSGA